MKKLFLLLVLCTLLGGRRGEAQINEKPFVVPELTSWQGAEGMFVPSGRVIVKGKRSTAVMEVARQLSEDYKLMFGRALSITSGKPRSGDFVLGIEEDTSLGQEGYRLALSEVAELTAHRPQGLYWGTRTILQLSEQHPERHLPCGTTRDIPEYALRGLLLDVARKYIPMDYLHSLVKVMAYYKMNTLQVHLNDNGFKQYFAGDWTQTSSAFRLESTTFPNLAIPGASYSKQAFIDFQILAERHFVEVIPEIDVPAHSLAFAHICPEIGSNEYGADHLDLFSDKTYEFVDKLFDEYLSGPKPVFRGPRVNIGTDEYSNAKEEVREQFRYFTDRYIKYVESYGKQVALWGALTHAYGTTPVKSQDVVMMCWYNGYADPVEMKKQGYQIVSIPDGYTYIVPAAGYYYDYLNTKRLHESWTPAQIGNVKFEERDPSLLGGMFAVWNDHYGNGISVKDIHHRIMPAMQTIAQKTWTASQTSISFEAFDIERHKLSEAPGINELARHGSPKTIVYQTAELSAGAHQPLEEIGYDYTVDLTIELNGQEEKGTELLRSRHATVYLSDPKEGKLGFARDGYLNTFRYTLPAEGTVQLSIRGNNKQTSLWVNGKHYETLGAIALEAKQTEANRFDPFFQAPDPFKPTVYKPSAKMYYQRTLVFPLREAGRYKARITNFSVKNYIPEP